MSVGSSNQKAGQFKPLASSPQADLDLWVVILNTSTGMRIRREVNRRGFHVRLHDAMAVGFAGRFAYPRATESLSGVELVKETNFPAGAGSGKTGTLISDSGILDQVSPGIAE